MDDKQFYLGAADRRSFDLLGRNYANRDILGNFPASVFNSSGQTIASTDPAGITTTAYYNGHGDLTATSLPSGKSVAYIHDIAGNPIKTIQAPGTAEQTTLSEILTRDAMLRPITVKDGEGSVTTYSYDTLGRTVSTTDQLGHKTEYTYDLEGQLLTLREADNILPSTAPPNSTRTYDALHRLKTEKDGKNQLTTYHYDAAGRMTSYVNARNATFVFLYDPLGRLTRRTEPDFTLQAYTYDVLGRLLTITKADGKAKTGHYENPLRDDLTRITYSSGEPQRSYTYTAYGQPLTAANATSIITWGYDTAGRKTSETQALQGVPGTHTFAYQFDGDGNLARHIRPDGSVVDYAYDPRNLLGGITSGTADPVARYTYNGRNQLEHTETEVGSALFTASRGYDGAGRPTSVINRFGKLPTLGATIDTTAYTLSPDGRRTGITRNGTAETYGYDAARQVESASIPLTGATRTNGYQYDAAGNRSTATTNGATTSYFANLLNEYTSWSGGILPPSHDANGNQLTTYTGATLAWDINNQLTSASNSAGDTATYEYDALGRRTKRTETISGTPLSTWFLTNGWNVELEFENGAYARRLTWGQDLSGSLQGAGGVGGLVMAEDLPPGGGAPVPHFPTYDGNGNITAWIAASGAVTARQRYDAFGNIIEQTGTAPSRYGFSTKPMDLVTGLLYYGYRYYDPGTGRWPSRDPIWENGGINLYGFVGNNGVNKWDVLGHIDNKKIKIIWKRDSTMNEEFTDHQKLLLSSQITFLREALSKCFELEKGCSKNDTKVDIVEEYDLKKPVLTPPDSGYDLRTEEGRKAFADASGKLQENIVPVTITKAHLIGLQGQKADGMGLSGNGIVMTLYSPGYTLAHELGHSVGYDCGDTDEGAHMTSDTAIMGVQGGAEVDDCWCKKIIALAK